MRWRKSQPNVKLCRPMGNWMPILPVIEAIAKLQTLQAAGQLDALKALIEFVAGHQTLPAAG